MDIQNFMSKGKEVKNLGFTFNPKTDFTRARCALEEILKHYKIKMVTRNDGDTIEISAAYPMFCVSSDNKFGLMWPRPGKSAGVAFASGHGDEIFVGIHGLNNPESETFYESGAGMYRIIGYGFTPRDLGNIDGREISFKRGEVGHRQIELTREGDDDNPHWVVRSVA